MGDTSNEVILEKIDHLGKRINIQLGSLKETVDNLADYQKAQNGRVGALETDCGIIVERVDNSCKQVDTLEEKSNIKDAIIGTGNFLVTVVSFIIGVNVK